jgi:hypothetical protein
MSTIVYKYRLWDPTVNAELVESTFTGATAYYNELVRIENHRRRRYRDARSEIFPEYAQAEELAERLDREVEGLREEIRAAKSSSRTRAVPEELAAQVQEASARRSEAWERLKELRLPILVVDEECEVALLRERLALPKRRLTDRRRASLEAKIAKLASKIASRTTQISTADRTSALELRRRSEEVDSSADAEVKRLRSNLFWGTYLLCEAAVNRARRDQPAWLAPKDLPEHRQPGRIGIQLQGGLPVSGLASDTRAQIASTSTFRPQKSGVMIARGKAGRTTFRLRVGTVEGKREPIWAEFPMMYHRALPSDGVVTWAVVTRRPGHLGRPWIYHLCLTVNTSQYHRSLPTVRQEGICAINFGWRQEADGSIRVASVNNDSGSPAHVHLPVDLVRRFSRCRDLQSIMGEKFDAAKSLLSSWIRERRGDLPPKFLESFEGISHWRSDRRLADLVLYWLDHRVPGDDEIFPALWQWRGRWFHLYQYRVCNHAKALRIRADLYRKLALELAQTSARLVIEDFEISRVAARPEAEEEAQGGQRARTNRTIAAVHELRTLVLQAAEKYHCPVDLVRASNNTRRCNVCGEIYEWDPAREVTHTCPGSGGLGCSTWDQDVNATDNAHERSARGEVVTIVEPANVRADGQVAEAKTLSFRTARRSLSKVLRSLDSRHEP